MIIRILREILTYIVGSFIFSSIDRINLRTLITNLTIHLQTMSTMNIILFLRDLIFNNNNFIFRLLATTPGMDINSLIDTRYKKVFWLGFVSTVLIYKQYVFFKRLILWPFKLGIYAFFSSILGIDLSWFISWFNFFPINIPNWVYIQYLTLYSNWLNWWNSTANVKSLNNNSLPSIDSTFQENPEPAENKNKIINKKNLLILAGILTLIGIGVWYYYYSGNGAGNGGGNGGNNLPPNLPQNPTNAIVLTDNQSTNAIVLTDNQTTILIDFNRLTEAERLNLLNHVNRLRNAARLTAEQHEYLTNRLLPPLPVYEGPPTNIEPNAPNPPF